MNFSSNFWRIYRRVINTKINVLSEEVEQLKSELEEANNKIHGV